MSDLLSTRHLVDDDPIAAQEFFHSRGLTDGLPVVPPTSDAVQAMLDWALMPPDALLGIEPVRERANRYCDRLDRAARVRVTSPAGTVSIDERDSRTRRCVQV